MSNSNGKYKLSTIVPVYNEQEILLDNLAKYSQYLDQIVGKSNWRYILVENGSTDNTLSILDEVIERWPASLVVKLDRPDYGLALRAGLQAVEEPWANIINVEQWDAVFLKWAWLNRERYDLFLGSKRADPFYNYQRPYRRFLSWGLNAVLQLLFEYTGADTHGPKFLSMANMRKILDETVLGRGQFDTEFTLRAIRRGLWIAEAPIVYEEQRPQRNWMITKIIRNVFDLFRLWRLMGDVPITGPVKFHRWCREDIEKAATSKS